MIRTASTGYHYAVKPVARVKPGQQFVLETRDRLKFSLNFNSTAEDVAAESTWIAAIR